MKYAQLIMGLLVGTALGGAVVASQGGQVPGVANDIAADTDTIKQIVRDTIKQEPQLILDSVQAYQKNKQQEDIDASSEALKDPAVRDAVLNDTTLPYTGNVNGSHVMAEFFDYNCPVCKMQFKIFQDLLQKDKELKIVFHEYPIFGPTSDTNSRIGLAVNHFYPEKYFAFHEKMMEGKGHESDNKRTYAILKEMGFDVKKIDSWKDSKEAAAQLDKSRELGQKLNVQGTPTMVVGDEIIPHAIEASELESKLSK